MPIKKKKTGRPVDNKDCQEKPGNIGYAKKRGGKKICQNISTQNVVTHFRKLERHNEVSSESYKQTSQDFRFFLFCAAVDVVDYSTLIPHLVLLNEIQKAHSLVFYFQGITRTLTQLHQSVQGSQMLNYDTITSGYKV